MPGSRYGNVKKQCACGLESRSHMEYNNAMDEILLGDVIQTRKKHPCGGDAWTVIRVGMDIKMRCRTCGRIVMLERAEYVKRMKKLIERANAQGEGEL